MEEFKKSNKETVISKSMYILGDSYSTFENYIPSSCAAWYVSGGTSQTDVTKVSETWWWLLKDTMALNLVRNNSWSGTTICYTGYGGNIVPEQSFIGRFKKDVQDGFFKNNDVDLVIIFGGTNDYWAGSPIGEIKWTDISDEDLKSTLPAFCKLLLSVKEVLPNAKIVNVINSDLGSDIVNGMITACKTQNITSLQLSGISKQEGHPTIEGMRQIYSQIYAILNT